MHGDLKFVLSAGLADVCHEWNIPLIIDEAHGAHFGMQDGFPASAMQQGADIAVQSTHKTLSAFGQSSMLHCQGARVSHHQLSLSLRTLQVKTATRKPFIYKPISPSKHKPMSFKGTTRKVHLTMYQLNCHPRLESRTCCWQKEILINCSLIVQFSLFSSCLTSSLYG